MDKHIATEDIGCFAEVFNSDPKNILALNAITQTMLRQSH